MKKLLFVYGTLRQGQGNHRLIQRCEFIGMAATVRAYTMKASGIPFVLKDPPRTHIRGEVYRLDTRELSSVDRLEGHPRNYRREEIPVLIDGQDFPVSAWIYFHPTGAGELIESGDYEDYSPRLIDADNP